MAVFKCLYKEGPERSKMSRLKGHYQPSVLGSLIGFCLKGHYEPSVLGSLIGFCLKGHYEASVLGSLIGFCFRGI